MKEYKINILPIAIEDIINIQTDIVGRYKDVYNADKVVNTIFDEINTLVSSPKRVEVRLIISELELRFLKIGKYTAIYHVDDVEKVVKIYGVFHSHRDLDKIVKNRI